MNKKIEIFVLIACIAIISGSLASYFLQDYTTYLLDEAGISMSQYSFYTMLSRAFSILPLNIVSSVWLWVESKKENRNRYIWAIFGFVFNIPGIGVYYGVAILDRMRNSTD